MFKRYFSASLVAKFMTARWLRVEYDCWFVTLKTIISADEVISWSEVAQMRRIAIVYKFVFCDECGNWRPTI